MKFYRVLWWHAWRHWHHWRFKPAYGGVPVVLSHEEFVQLSRHESWPSSDGKMIFRAVTPRGQLLVMEALDSESYWNLCEARLKLRQLHEAVACLRAPEKWAQKNCVRLHIPDAKPYGLPLARLDADAQIYVVHRCRYKAASIVRRRMAELGTQGGH